MNRAMSVVFMVSVVAVLGAVGTIANAAMIVELETVAEATQVPDSTGAFNLNAEGDALTFATWITLDHGVRFQNTYGLVNEGTLGDIYAWGWNIALYDNNGTDSMFFRVGWNNNSSPADYNIPSFADPTLLARNTQVHLAVTAEALADGYAVKFYVNGVETSSHTSHTGLSTYYTNQQVKVGQFGNGSDWYNLFPGTMSKMRLYDNALTTEEINTVMTETAGPPHDPEIYHSTSPITTATVLPDSGSTLEMGNVGDKMSFDTTILLDHPQDLSYYGVVGKNVTGRGTDWRWAFALHNLGDGTDRLVYNSQYNSYMYEGTTPIPHGLATHISATVEALAEGYLVKTYVNGVLDATFTGINPVTPYNPGLPITIGRFGTGEYPNFPGKMTDFRLYDRALSGSAIAGLVPTRARTAVYELPSVTEAAVLPDSSLPLDLAFAGAEMTMATAITPDHPADGNYYGIVSKNPNGINADWKWAFSLTNTPDGDKLTFVSPYNNNQYASTTLLPLGTFAHVAATVQVFPDGYTVRMFVNGDLTDTFTGIEGQPRFYGGDQPLTVGRLGSASYTGFPGQMTDFRLYDVALTNDEILALVPPSLVNPLKYYADTITEATVVPGSTTKFEMGTDGDKLTMATYITNDHPSNAGQYYGLLSKCAADLNGGGGGWNWAILLEDTGAGDRLVYHTGYNGDFVPSGTVIPYGSDVHLAATAEAVGNLMNVKFYLDGALIDTLDNLQFAISWTPNNPLMIGKASDFNNIFPGTMTEFRLYNTVLNGAEIAALLGLTAPTTWTAGGGSNTNWTIASNWDAGVPGTSSVAIFPLNVARTVTLDSTQTVAGVSITGANSRLDVYGTIDNNFIGTATLTTGGFTFGALTNTMFNPLLSGAAPVVTTGHLILTNAGNDFSGDINVAGGTLAASSNGALGNAGNAITLGSTGRFGGLSGYSQARVAFNRTITLAGNGGIIGNGGYLNYSPAPLDLQGTISGSSKLVVFGGAPYANGPVLNFTWLDGDNTAFTGGTIVVTGGVGAGDGYTNNNVFGTGDVIVDAAGTLVIRGANNMAGSAKVLVGPRANLVLQGDYVPMIDPNSSGTLVFDNYDSATPYYQPIIEAAFANASAPIGNGNMWVGAGHYEYLGVNSFAALVANDPTHTYKFGGGFSPQMVLQYWGSGWGNALPDIGGVKHNVVYGRPGLDGQRLAQFMYLGGNYDSATYTGDTTVNLGTTVKAAENWAGNMLGSGASTGDITLNGYGQAAYNYASLIVYVEGGYGYEYNGGHYKKSLNFSSGAYLSMDSTGPTGYTDPGLENYAVVHFLTSARGGNGTLALRAEGNSWGYQERVYIADMTATNGMIPAYFWDSKNNEFLDYGANGFVQTTLQVGAIAGAAATAIVYTGSEEVIGTNEIYALRTSGTLSGNGTVKVNSGGVIFAAGGTHTPSFDFGTGEGLVYTPADTTLQGQIFAGTLTKSGAGSLNLTGDNSASITGNIVINQGILTFTGTQACAGKIVLDGGQLNTGGVNFSQDIELGANGGSLFTGWGSPTVSSNITGSGTLWLNTGENQFTFGGAGNTYSGGTYIAGAGNGQWSRIWVASNSSLGTGDVVLNGYQHTALIFQGDNNLSPTARLSILSTGIVYFAGPSTPRVGSLEGVGTILLGQNYYTSGSNTLVVGMDSNVADYYGNIVDGSPNFACGLTKVGTGTQTLWGENAYMGLTTVNDGTLVNNNYIAGQVSIAGGFYSGTGTTAGLVTVAGGTLTGTGFLNNGLHLNSGAVTGSTTIYGGVTVNGGDFGGSGTANGAFVANGGSVSGTAAINGDVTVAGAAFGGSHTITGTVTMTSGSFSGSSTISGAVQIDNGTFSGTHTINNNFTLNDGVVSGSDIINGDVAVNGGTFGGTHSITGNVTAGAAIVAPGNSAGTITIGGSLTLDAATTLNFELGAPGSLGTSDLIDITGNLTLDGTLNVAALEGFNEGTYRLFNYALGGLSDLGLTIGTTPGMGFNYEISTATDGQIDLLVSTPWDLYDTNHDGVKDSLDIDAIFQNFTPIIGSYQWDVDQDGDVDKDDVTAELNLGFLTNYADANLDTKVDLVDFQALLDNWQNPGGWDKGDFTGDGQVEFEDFQVLLDYWNPSGIWGFSQVPEPTTMVLLALGGLALLRRNRRA